MSQDQDSKRLKTFDENTIKRELSELANGIPDDLPNYQFNTPRDPSVPHAPKRPIKLNEDQKIVS